MKCNKSENTCDKHCPGWAWFNDREVQRCDECDTFGNDEEAVSHILRCVPCSVMFARTVAQTNRGEFTAGALEETLSTVVRDVLEGPCAERCMDDAADRAATASALVRAILGAP